MFSKKTAVAAAALLAAFAAQAQVTLYGNVDLSVGRFELPFGDDTTAVESGIMKESFLGFRGEEDLGAGLKAYFQLETAIGADTGLADGPFWGRTSVIGLAGSFGTVTLGNARTLNFLANQAYNPFDATGLFSTSSNLFESTAVFTGGTTLAVANSNFANSITYTSPNMSGFTAAVQLGLSENDTDGTDDDAFGLQLNYAAGPLSVGFTYEDAEESVFVGTTRWQLGASYDFGGAKLYGQVGKAEADGSSEDYKFYQIGAGVPVSAAGNVLVSYGQGKIADLKGRQLSLAYDHSLSKRTGAYVGLVHLNADDGTDDDSGNSFVAGIRHSF